MSPVAWLLSAALAVTLGIALYSADKGRWVNTVWWGFAFCVVLCIGTLYALLPMAREKEQGPTPPKPDLAQAALDKLAAQADATLRPYLGVSAVSKKRMEIGKTVWIAIEFTNMGKTPANNAEVRGRLQKLPKGTPFDRNYSGRGFEIVSREHVNVGDTIAADFISQNDNQANVLTMDDLMQLTTDKSYVLAVHGIVRYHSTYIPGGVEETSFCYEFDPLTGEMLACRVVDAPEHSEMPSDTHTLERARFNIENRKIEMLDGGKTLRVEYEAVNRGRSAATITRTGDNLYVLPVLPQPPVVPDWRIETEVVHTGQAMVCELILHSIEAEKVRDFEARRSRLYVIGRIEYTDVFGKSHERWLCVRV